MYKNEIKYGLSAKYLSNLSKLCLVKPTLVLPCDYFLKLHTLPINSNSKYSGSHYVAVIVKRNSVWYFDSIGLPPGMFMNSSLLKRLKKLEKIYYGVKINSRHNFLFCGFYCMSFLVTCLDEKVKYKDFLSHYMARSYARNERCVQTL